MHRYIQIVTKLDQKQRTPQMKVSVCFWMPGENKRLIKCQSEVCFERSIETSGHLLCFEYILSVSPADLSMNRERLKMVLPGTYGI